MVLDHLVRLRDSTPRVNKETEPMALHRSRTNAHDRGFEG
jgi:hypothetical protein